jgi:hypothetical protein
MQKTAQKRNVFNKLREFTDISGKAAEAFFNPQFKELMERIRIKDDRIRSIVVGKKLGDADKEIENDSAPAPESYGPGLKDILKQAKSNLNRREFMSAVHDLVEYHDKVTEVVAQIKSVEYHLDKVHEDFLFEKLTPEQKAKLVGKKFAHQQAELVKQAGYISDFFHNMKSRGRGLAAWEKRFPKDVNKIKNGLTIIFQKSEALLSTIIGSLKDMASARSVRNPDDYFKGTDKIKTSFEKYNAAFKTYYEEVISSRYLKQMQEYDKAQEPVPTKENASEPTSVPGHNRLPGVDLPDNAKPSAPSIIQPPAPSATTSPTAHQALSKLFSNPISTPAPAAAEPKPSPAVAEPKPASKPVPNFTAELNVPEPRVRVSTEPNSEPEPDVRTRIGAEHKKFYASLESLSGESPSMLALFIKKYANSIKLTNPKISSKLFKIAQQIKG